MTKRLLLLLVIVILWFGLSPARAAQADGIIIPEPPHCPIPICLDLPCPPPPPCPPTPITQLIIRYHHVNVTIEDQITITRVEQVFYNPNDWAIEGTYLFPIPLDATLTSFKLWVDGEAIAGEILPADQARQKYEEIVASLRDPALLEYIDRGAVQARIFPIPARRERKIALEYAQILPLEGNLIHYLYPLSTEKFSLQPLESVVITVDFRSATPIRTIYSPSHPVTVVQTNDTEAQISYEENQVRPDQDFSLFISLGESPAIHLFTYRDAHDPSDQEGMFLLLLAPSPKISSVPIPKDLLLVLDRSGSMEGEKFQQALEATQYILDHLNPADRFNILAFSTEILQYQTTLRPASESAEAKRWLKTLTAEGSTDIHTALLQAIQMAAPERPTYLIFLTDGLPTVGIQDSALILEAVHKNAPQNLRLFPFGVGYDVDTFLLDTLAQENHGRSTYVQPGEDLTRRLSAFYERIETPLLTNLALDFGEIEVYDLYPTPLPDLFAGSQILVVGRYKEGGKTDIRLSGEVNGITQTFNFQNQVFVREATTLPTSIQAAIPRLWATRKIGHLLTQIRLRGANPETIDQIVRLSIRYGIVTPYTSYLVSEESPLAGSEQARIGNEQWQSYQKAPLMETSGMGAVHQAADQGALSVAEAPPAIDSEYQQKIKILAGRTFVYSKEVWVDTAFDPEKMTTQAVAFLSPDYFRLLDAYPSLGAAFSLGEQVIVLANGVAYEVVPADSIVPPLDIATSTPIATPTPQPHLATPSPLPSNHSPGANPTSPFPCLSIITLISLLTLSKLLTR
ncbi:MAG: VIT domain-containing protein [Anaerolineales bacterium]